MLISVNAAPHIGYRAVHKNKVGPNILSLATSIVNFKCINHRSRNNAYDDADGKRVVRREM